MITSEALMQGLGNTDQRGKGILPDIFNDVEPIEFNSITADQCEDYVKEGLTTCGVGVPRNSAMSSWFQMYVRAGYRKATPDDFRQREDGSPGCALQWDEKEQGYIDGDIVIMVISKARKLGFELNNYLAANLPLMNKDQRAEVMKKISVPDAVAQRVAVLDAAEGKQQGTASPKTGIKAERQAFNVSAKETKN